jgi:hypothetical protein
MKILSFDVGIVNLAYCIVESAPVEKILHWEVISLENTTDHAKLYTNLIKALDSREHLLDNIHTVLIEKQPAFNPKMRIIAGCLQTYFYIRGVVDSETIKKIIFYSPKHKIKCESDYSEFEVTGKSKYQRTKKLGILICRKKLDDHPDWVSFFETHKKKDDLADCYLQAASYLGMSDKSIPTSRITKTTIKKKVKEYLDRKNAVPKKLTVVQLMNVGNENTQTLLNILNSMDLDLKNKVCEKYLFTFPLTLESMNTLLVDMKLKGYLNFKW